MKLGKALATGVAEERPRAHDEELELAEELEELEELKAIEVSVPEELPSAR